MEDTLQAAIAIQMIESSFIPSGAQVFKLKTDKGTFSFFSKKRDGSDTKAYEQFQKFGFKMGDIVEVAYKTSQSGMNQHTGKPYVNNQVIFFKTQDEHTPATPKIPAIQIEADQEAPSKSDDETFLKIQSLSQRLDRVEQELGIKSDEIKLENVPW